MRLRRFFLIAFVCLSCTHLPAQFFQNYVSIDSSTLDNVSLLTANDVTPLGGGRYAIVGAVTGSDSANWTRQSMYVLQADKHGQALSYHEYEDQDVFIISGPRAYGICSDGQSALYLAGGSNNRQMILKVGEGGGLHWTIAQNHHEYYDVLCSNAGVTFLGQDESQLGLHDFSISQLAADGTGGMGMMYGTADFEIPEKLLELPGGGFLMVGTTSATGNFRIMVVRVDASLQMVWGKIYGDPDSTRRLNAKDAVIAADGFYIAGHTPAVSAQGSDSLLLMKIDTAGNHIATWLYGDASWTSADATKMTADPDGNMYLAASVRDTGYSFPVLLKIAPSGSPVLAQSYDDGDPNSEEFLNGLVWDGALFGVGDRTRILPPFQLIKDILIARFDDTLQTGCGKPLFLGANSTNILVTEGLLSQPYQITDTLPFGHHAGGLQLQNRCMVMVGLDARQPHAALLEFENPARLNWQVKYALPEGGGYLEMMDMQGRIQLRRILPGGSGTEQVSLAGVADGLYIVRALGEGWASEPKRVLVLE